MGTLIIAWLISAVSLLIVGHIIPGFEVLNFGSALIAAVVIGLINATVGLFLKIITFPISILTFGIFLLIINALMLMFASSLLEGFTVTGFWAAFFGAIVLAVVNMLFRSLVGGRE
jgi:putative membrane protein